MEGAITKLGAVCLVTVFLSATAGAAEPPKLPSEKELRSLALASILAFNQAIQSRDFAAFHGKISEMWQKQITPKKLAEVFKTFADQGIDLSLVSSVDPIFEKPPKIDEDGVLILEGRYPTLPNKTEFRLKYLNEKATWKLFGIKVDVAPDPANVGAMPSEKEVKALLLDSLGHFNQAVQKKSFVPFHQQIAAVWRKQITPEKLQALFQVFIEQESDIAPILKLEPIFDQPPAINDAGLLELKGSFLTRPSKVGFNLAYLYEAPDWKLVKINVKVDAGESRSSG